MYSSARSTIVAPFRMAIMPSRARRIFRCVAAVAAAVVVAAFLYRAPSMDCDGALVRSTVLDIVKQHSRLPNNTEYELDRISKTGEDPAVGSLSCEADVFGAFNDTPYSTAHLTYTVTRQADGQARVSVQGISGLNFP